MSIWSLQGTGFGAEHPYHGIKRMTYTEHWGKNKSNSVPIDGSNWLAIWKAADRLIRESGDRNHVYIEGFDRVEMPDSTEVVLDLQTGS
jgi:hypothetical protein